MRQSLLCFTIGHILIPIFRPVRQVLASVLAQWLLFAGVTFTEQSIGAAEDGIRQAQWE
jgi:hypothetical protein